MPGFVPGMRHARAYATLCGLLALLAGCSGAGTSNPDTSASPAPRPSIVDFFSGASQKGAQTVAGAQPDFNCPPIEIRRGASTLTIGPDGDQKSAMSVKYQVSFTRLARECAVADGNMVMRVGVEGRAVVGPLGGPGHVDVPMRFAVVQEVPGGMRAIATKFILIPVDLQPGQGNVPFTRIEDGLTFPIPAPPSQLDNYIVYVGFDPASAEAQARTRTNPAAKPRPKPQPAASAN
jgi:hypothetical protein